MDDLDSYDDLKDDMQELLDASKELVDGTNDLVDGVEELKDGSDDLYDGAVELDDGAKDLKDGATELDDGAYDLQDGALELKNALKEYNAGMDTLVAAMKDADGNGTDLATVANQLAAGVSQTVDSVLANTLATINEKVAPYKKYGVPQFSSIDEFLEFDPSPLAGAIEKLVYAGEMSQDQAAAISAVVADLPAQKEEVKATQTQLLYLKDSMNQFAAGIGTIYTATTTQLQPGAAKILDGSRELYAGTKDLKEGTEELLDGTVELKDGTAELLDGTVDLKDGVQELYDGSIELRDGMEEFDEDGIQKLYDMIYTDMQKVIDRARAVTDAGKAYQSFTQIAPGMNGSVKFLIETEAIE
jgi:putative membrane protein